MERLFVNGKEIVPPNGTELNLDSSNDERVSKWRFKQRNKSVMLLPGEMAITIDGHTLMFCFNDGELKSLNFDENVTEETAKELIQSIKLFYENRFRG